MNDSRWVVPLFIVAVLVLPASVYGNRPIYRPVTVDCLMDAAQTNNIPADALLTVLAAEGGQVGSRSPNYDDDGNIFSYDIGPAQINSKVWLDIFLDMGFTYKRIKNDGCVNVQLGAWILRDRWRKAREEYDQRRRYYWYAIGEYHSYTPEHRKKYVNHALESVREMTVQEILDRANQPLKNQSQKETTG